MTKHTIALILDLFDGGAGAGADGAGAGEAGAGNGESQAPSSPAVKKNAANPLSAVQYGKQAEADPTIGQTEEKQQTPADRAAAFEKLIKEDYKDLFNQKMQSVIDKRFAETKTLRANLEQQAPLLDKLMARYGVSDLAALDKAVDEDTAYLEQAAEKAGMPLEQFRNMNTLRLQNEQLRRQAQEQQRAAEAERIYNGWLGEVDALKAADPMYSGFDLEAEIQNSDFRKMLQAGVSVKAAYDALHAGDMMKAAYTAAQQETVNNIQKRNSRPAENGTAQSAGISVKTDVTKLTKADRAEIARRAARGENITF